MFGVYNYCIVYDSHYLFQLPFQNGSAPVFLRGKSDRFIYRSAIGLSVCGIGISLYGIYLMATGKMQKKT